MKILLKILVAPFALALSLLADVYKRQVHRKGNKLVVISHIADKNLEHKREKLKEQAKRIVPVSYTHLDVYKRQAQNLLTAGFHYSRLNVENVR